MSHRSPYLSAGKKNPKPKHSSKKKKKPLTNLDPFKNAILGMFGFQD